MAHLKRFFSTFNSLTQRALVTSVIGIAGVHAEGGSTVTPVLQEAAKNVEFSGFLSVRGAKIQENDLVYVNKYDNVWSFSKESVFGLQMNSKAADKINVSMQMTASGGDDPVSLEWAYIEYAFAPDLKARAGRLRAPGFMLSEFLDVGYAYPWVQTPYEVYGWLPFSRYEGVDLRYWTSIADADIRINPYVGTTSGQALSLGDLKYTDQTSQFGGVELQATYDIFTFRAGYSRYRFDLTNARLDGFMEQIKNGKTYVPETDFSSAVKRPGYDDIIGYMDLLLQLGLSNPSAAETQGLVGSAEDIQAEQAILVGQQDGYNSLDSMGGKFDGSFAGIGFSADNGKYLVMSELSSSKIGGQFPDVNSGYILLGYRMGAWMPHITLSKMYTTDEDKHGHVAPLDLNDALWRSVADSNASKLADGAELYNGLLTTTLGLIKVKQETVTLGLRWDPTPGLDLKWEVFAAKPISDTYGFAIPANVVALATMDEVSESDINIPPPPKHVVGLRMSIDTVF